MADTTLNELQALLMGRTPEKVGKFSFLNLAPCVHCADGFNMSVQASSTHYCSPRNNSGPWHSVEVGYPSERVEALMPYIDGKDSEPTETVYGYVPILIVVDAIDAHGGFAKAEGGR